MSTSTDGIKPEPLLGSDTPEQGSRMESEDAGCRLADEAGLILDTPKASSLPLTSGRSGEKTGASRTENDSDGSLTIVPLAELSSKNRRESGGQSSPEQAESSLLPGDSQTTPSSVRKPSHQNGSGGEPENTAGPGKAQGSASADNAEPSVLPTARRTPASNSDKDETKPVPATPENASGSPLSQITNALPKPGRLEDLLTNGSAPTISEADKDKTQPASPSRPHSSGSPERETSWLGSLSNLFNNNNGQPEKDKIRPQSNAGPDNTSPRPQNGDTVVGSLGNLLAGVGVQVAGDNAPRPTVRYGSSGDDGDKPLAPVVPLQENPSSPRVRTMGELLSGSVSSIANNTNNTDLSPSPRKPGPEQENSLSNLLRNVFNSPERETAVPVPAKPEPPANLLSNVLEQLIRDRPQTQPLQNQITNPGDEKEHPKPINPEREKEELRPVYVVPASSPDLKPDERVIKNNYSVQRLEMQSAGSQGDERILKNVSRLDEKVGNLLSLFAELKPLRASDADLDSNVQKYANSNAVIARQDLPLVPTLVRMADLAVEFKRSSLPDKQQANALDPANASMSSARRMILAEAMSLKDLISANKAELIGSGIHGGRPGHIAGIKSLDEQILGIRAGLMSGGKLEPGIQIKGLDGRIDGASIGMKGTESIDAAKQGGRLTPQAPTPEGKGLPGTDRKDTIDKKDESKENFDVKILIAAEKVKNGKKGDKTEKDEQDKKAENKNQEARRRYLVKEGDTLESIAEKMLGDGRFSMLIEMINRGSIRYRFEGATKIALLRPGQVLWLPTSKEQAVHRALYFCKSSVSAPVEKGTAAADVSENGEGETANLPELELTENSNRDDARAGENGSFTVIQDFLKKLREFGPDAVRIDTRDHAGLELPVVADDDEYLCEFLDAGIRLVTETIDLELGESKFLARLEKELNGQWKTVAYYESNAGRSVRYLNKANGARSALQINIPESIVREMAVKDFRRNWRTYSAEF